MYYIKDYDTRPQYNLALEEYLCRLAEIEGSEFFMLWQNEPSIIIGRYQNTFCEINSEFVKENNIHVVRRNSGGGAVYHDMGNINYSFITKDKGSFDFASLTKPIICALAALGVKAEHSGRNDITIEGKKISGGAQYRHNGVLLHHGTLLFDSDLDVLSKALKVSENKFKSKGVASVRSRVTNIRPYLPQAKTVREFIALLEAQINGLIPRELTNDDNESVKKLMDEKYSTWEWNYGNSPEFTQSKKKRFKWGEVDALLEVKNGIIKGCSFYGDYFGNGDYSTILERIIGLTYTREAISEALKGLNTLEIFSGSTYSDIECLISPDV